jgi:hypothetical protein
VLAAAAVMAKVYFSCLVIAMRQTGR